VAAERTFRAMGTTAHVIVESRHADRHLDTAQARIEYLEATWSRFLPDSELSRLNTHHNRPVVVSTETFDVISLAVDAWFLTAGRFDPTVLPALAAAGYDRSFEGVRAAKPKPLPNDPAPGCAEIRLIAPNAVVLPAGVQLDLGGIGKGYAADLVSTELMDDGADGACVSIGGDLRCVGTAPWPEGWLVDVAHPFDESKTALTVALADGAVVTTTRMKRSWGPGNRRHHVIDPATGRPAQTGVSAVTVVSGQAWWAEVLAKAAFLAGPTAGVALLKGHGVTGVVFDDEGRAHPVERLDAFTATNA